MRDLSTRELGRVYLNPMILTYLNKIIFSLRERSVVKTMREVIEFDVKIEKVNSYISTYLLFSELYSMYYPRYSMNSPINETN